MTSLAEAFTREHHEIDEGIETYVASTETDARLRADPLLAAMEALRRHIYLEEEIVFPHLPVQALMMPLMVMRREHGELWRRMDDLQGRITSPESGAVELEASCRELLELLDAHNSKEEPIIYPHLDADLSEDEQQRVRSLLTEGALPEGWVCQDV